MPFIGAGFLGRATTVDEGALSLVWPAAGVATCWITTSRGRTLGLDVLTLFSCSFLVNVTTGASWVLASMFGFCNVIQALAFVGLMRVLVPHLHPFGGDQALHRLDELARLILAAAIATLLGATCGGLGLLLIMGEATVSSFVVWWGRNLVGVLLVGTLGLMVMDDVRRRATLSRGANGIGPGEPLRRRYHDTPGCERCV